MEGMMQKDKNLGENNHLGYYIMNENPQVGDESLSNREENNKKLKKELDGYESTIYELGTTLLQPCTPEEIAQELCQSKVIVEQKKGNLLIIDVASTDNLKKLEYGIYEQIETAFKKIGGEAGTGIKTDRYNNNEIGFRQLVVVPANPNAPHVLLAGYRYKLWEPGNLHTPMMQYFDFDQRFLNANHKIIELGTARRNNNLTERETLFPLTGTWTGLGGILESNEATHFIGKMTIPSDYPKEATDFALWYLDLVSRTQGGSINEGETTPSPAQAKTEYVYTSDYIPSDEDIKNFTGNFKKDFLLIKPRLEQLTQGKISALPGMFGIYLSRSTKLNYLSSVRNGNVIEAGILVAVDDVTDEAKRAHLEAVADRKQKMIQLKSEKDVSAFSHKEDITVQEYRDHFLKV